MFSEQQVRLAARMYEVRDAARRIAGAKYPEQIAGWKDALARIAERLQVSAVAAVPMICKTNPVGEMELMWLTAAAVELSEQVSES